MDKKRKKKRSHETITQRRNKKRKITGKKRKRDLGLTGEYRVTGTVTKGNKRVVLWMEKEAG